MLSPTNTPVARWRPSLSVSTSGWTPGDYLLRLTDDRGAQNLVPITLRSPSNTARVVLLNAVTTWQAYNDWGGYSLYHGPGGKADSAHRARAVAFDRPYAAEDGAGEFVLRELPMVVLAERLGLPLGYATDVDVHAQARLLDGARALISLGHDEYWSGAMRAAVMAHRERGMNIAFLGANAVFRHIRFAGTGLGADRLEIDYKTANADPIYRSDPREATTNWREPPYPRPESVLTGTFYECNPVRADMVVADAPSWLFAGTAVTNGTRLPRLVFPEYDRVNPGVPTPRPIEIVFHSPVRCRHVGSFADAAYYTRPSGAAVFDAGTNGWVPALTRHGTTARGQAIVTAVSDNLLRAFAAGPAGWTHPAVDNLAAMHEYAGDPIAVAVASATGGRPR